MPDVTDILEEFSEKLGMIREIAGMMAYTDWDELTNRKGAGSLRYIGEFILETLSEFEESMKGAAEEDYYDFHLLRKLANLPHDAEYAAKGQKRAEREEADITPEEKESSRMSGLIHEMTYTMNYACGDPEKIEQMAKLGRLMKADPGLVLAFIENAKEPEPAKVVELPAAKENTESEDEDE